MTAQAPEVDLLDDIDFDEEVPCFAREEMDCQRPATWQSIVWPCGHRRVYCDYHHRQCIYLARLERERRPDVTHACSVCKVGPSTVIWRNL